MTIAWTGLALFAALVGITDYLLRQNAKDRTAEAQVRRLEEANRDRSNDWERHRG